MNSLDILLGTPLFCLFFTIASGLLLSKLSFKGVSLGTAGVLFVALFMGHFGYKIPEGIGTLGLVFFIYCIGISAGGRFFSSLSKEGMRPVFIALVTMLSGGLILYIGQQVLNLPKEIAIGLYAGALSSAPALAAASEGVLGDGQDVIVGYGLAYPLGTVGIILCVQLLPTLFCKKALQEEVDHSGHEEEVLRNVLVEVTNEALVGRQIANFGLNHLNRCQIARRLEGERLLPLAYQDSFLLGQHILIVGREEDLDVAIDFIGVKSSRHYVRDTENERQHLQIYSKNFIGKSITELAPLQKYGVMITRISRYGFTFIPENNTVIENRDVLRVIGQPDAIKCFAKAIGHKKSSPAGMELLSMSIGIMIGVLFGMIPLSLPGSEPITFGLAGGTLITALIFGHFGHIGHVVTHIRRETRELIQSIGLVFFIADSGIKGGAGFLETFEAYGFPLLLLGFCITIGSAFTTFLVIRFYLKFTPLSSLGTLCGSMTSTPALGSLTGKYPSQVPVVSYATIYPVALIIITFTVKFLLHVL